MNCPKCQHELTQVGKFWVCAEHGQVDTQEDSSADARKVIVFQKVFISYGRADAMEFVERLASDLKQRGGHQVWVDLENIEKGGLFEVRIEQGIRQCTVLVAVMTKRSLAEDSVCRDEVVFAMNEGKPIVPLRVDPDSEAKPSLLLARRNWIDFTEDYDKAFEALLRYLAGDESVLLHPQLPTVTGVAPLDFSIEIAKFYAGVTGRQWLGAEIDHWLNDSDKRAFVIVGEPGVGKSSTAACLSQTRGDVVGIHFCTQQNTRSRNPYEFVACLVGQLCASLPGFAETVKGKHPEVRRPTAGDAFRELIVEPSQDLAEPPSPRLIIVDSLDEAATVSGESIVDVLVRQAPDLPSWLRIVTTTRPEEPILARIRNLNVFELSADRREHRDGLRQFIAGRLSAAPLADLIGTEVAVVGTRIETLAEGNFLYARLVLDALQDKSLAVKDLGRLTPDLTVFYSEMFRRRFSDTNKYSQVYGSLAKTLAVAREPLSFDLLLRICGAAPEVLNSRVLDLRAYLKVSGQGDSATYALYHKTLADWLCDREAAGTYWCNTKAGHAELADALWDHWREDEYALRHLPAHLVGSSDWVRLANLLCNLEFLEAKAEAGMVFDLAVDFADAVAVMPVDDPRQNILRLLEEALRRDIHFIARHTDDYPQALFQCLWNSCWWYDSPEAARHYCDPGESQREPPPWRRPGPKLYQLVESWRAKVDSIPDRLWLCSLRPPDLPLGVMHSSYFLGHRGKVQSIAVSADDCDVVTAGEDMTIRLWNLRNGRETLCLAGHRSAVSTVAYSPDRQMICSVGSDNTVRLWSACSGTELRCLSIADGAVLSAAFSPNGKHVVCGTDRGDISVYDINSKERRLCLGGHEDSVLSLAWKADNLVVSASSDNTIRMWDLTQQQPLFCFKGHRAEVFDVEIVTTLNQIASGGADNTLRLWDGVKGTELACFDHDAPVFCVAASPDGKRIAAGTADGRVWLWDLSTKKLLQCVEWDDGAMVSLVFFSDGRRIVTGTWDGTVRIWDTDCAEEQLVLRGHGETVQRVAFSPNGRHVVSASDSGILRVWDAENGREITCMRGKEGMVRQLGYSQDGRRIIVRGKKMSKVWDAETGCQLQAIQGDNDIIGKCVLPTTRNWRIVLSKGESVVQSVRTGCPRAWLAEEIDEIETHTQRPSWAGIAHGRLFLFELVRGDVK